MCLKPTNFIEINFEAFLHPGLCNNKAWEEYYRAIYQYGPFPKSFYDGIYNPHINGKTKLPHSEFRA